VGVNKAALKEDGMTLVEDGLKIHGYHVDGVAVVVVCGELDANAVPALRAAFDELGPDEHVYVDCAGVGYIDTDGLAVLCEIARRNVSYGGPLHVLASTALRRSLWINDVGHLFILD
jgi:anti-anti-sigma factor